MSEQQVLTSAADAKKPTDWRQMPTDWHQEELDSVTTLITDGTHNPPPRVSDGIPIISGQNIKNSGIDFQKEPSFISEEDFHEMDRNINIQPGDLLLTIVGTLGRSTLVEDEEKFAIQRSIALVRASDEVNQRFLKTVTDSYDFKRQMEMRSRATAQKGLYLEALRKINIPVPPLPEQRKIASVLYTVDQAIQKTEAIIAQTERVKQGVMQRLFTEGYYEHDIEEVEGRPLPAEWSLSPVGDLFGRIDSGGTPKRGEEKYWNSEFLPFVKIEDMTGNEREGVSDTSEYVSEKAVEENQTKVFEEGAILIAIYGSIGKTAIANRKLATNQAIVGLEEPAAERYYIRYCLDHHRPNLRSLSRQTTQANIGQGILKKFKLPVPTDKEEQEKIADTLRSLDTKIILNQKKGRQLRRAKKGLMQDLLTGEVRTKGRDIPLVDAVREVEG